MKQDRSKIAEMVKSGEYFKQSFEFYSVKYLYQLTIRTQFLILFALLGFATFTSFETFRQDYKTSSLAFAIYAVDQVKYFPILKPLAFKKEPIETSVARYMLERYVKLREYYNPADFTEGNSEAYQNRIYALSSRQMIENYQDLINPEVNSNSPILKYKNRFIREVTIKSINLKEEQGSADQAEIIYEVALFNKATKQFEPKEEYKAEIKYIINNIDRVYNKQEKLYFAVTDYNTYKLSK